MIVAWATIASTRILMKNLTIALTLTTKTLNTMTLTSGLSIWATRTRRWMTIWMTMIHDEGWKRWSVNRFAVQSFKFLVCKIRSGKYDMGLNIIRVSENAANERPRLARNQWALSSFATGQPTDASWSHIERKHLLYSSIDRGSHFKVESLSRSWLMREADEL